MRFGLDVAQHRLTWEELLDRVRLAEVAGFDGAWAFDHFKPLYGEGPGPCFEGLTVLAGLAAATQLGFDRLTEAAGRDPAAIGQATSLSLSGDLGEVRRSVDRWCDIGFTYLVCGFPTEGRSRVEEFVERVMPVFAG